MDDKPRYARNASRSICSRRAGCCSSEVRDTTEAGEHGCESLPRVVKSRGAVKKAKEDEEEKETKGTEEDEAASGRE